MKQRLQTLLAAEKIASSKFADIIGVNRSSISHLLSGRNNPSLDFLQKVLVKFPNINPDWLLLGQGSMYRNNIKIEDKTTQNNPVLFEDKREINKEVSKEEPVNNITESKIEDTPSIKPQSLNESSNDNEIKPEIPINNNNLSQKQLQRIIFFYTDGTFDVYLPNKNM